MPTKHKSLVFGCYQVTYQDGKHEVLFLTPAELAGFKRSARYKNRVAFSRLSNVHVSVKISVK